MGRLRFFQGLIIVLSLLCLSLGAFLLQESISHPEQSWPLLAGAILCSLALMFAYFLGRQRADRKYL
jgi:O-antigen/teichoic acid export membrane protein